MLLAVRTNLVLSLVARGENTHVKNITVGGLVLLGVLILIGRAVAVHPWLQPWNSYSSDFEHRSNSRGNTVTIEKVTNTVAARDWYSTPVGQDMLRTNEYPDITNASMTEVIEFLKKRTAEQPTAGDHAKATPVE